MGREGAEAEVSGHSLAHSLDYDLCYLRSMMTNLNYVLRRATGSARKQRGHLGEAPTSGSARGVGSGWLWFDPTTPNLLRHTPRSQI